MSWDDALDIVAESLLKAEQRHGSQTVWPYYYAGTMGLVMRDGINRLRHVKRYSGQYSTVWRHPGLERIHRGERAGSRAAIRARWRRSDLVVIWGTNAAATQINVMTHALEARRRRDAPIVVIDTYRNATAKQADLFVCVRPGTDGALACAVMHVLFRDGYANPRVPRALHRLSRSAGAAPSQTDLHSGRSASPACRRTPSSGSPG